MGEASGIWNPPRGRPEERGLNLTWRKARPFLHSRPLSSTPHRRTKDIARSDGYCGLVMERERPIKWCVGTVQKSSRTRGREGGKQRWTKPQRLRGRFLRSLSSTFSSSSSSDADSGPLNAFSSCNVDVGSQLSVNTRRAGAQASKQPAHPRSSPLPPTPFLRLLTG